MASRLTAGEYQPAARTAPGIVTGGDVTGVDAPPVSTNDVTLAAVRKINSKRLRSLALSLTRSALRLVPGVEYGTCAVTARLRGDTVTGIVRYGSSAFLTTAAATVGMYEVA